MDNAQRRTLEMLAPSYAATPDLFVPRGKLAEHLQADIETTERVKLLVAGQRGMGKTTELRRLAHLLDAAGIRTFFIQFGSLEAISHPLLIETMARMMIETSQVKLKEKIKSAFFDWFNEELTTKSRSEGTEGAASIGASTPFLTGKRGRQAFDGHHQGFPH